VRSQLHPHLLAGQGCSVLLHKQLLQQTVPGGGQRAVLADRGGLVCAVALRTVRGHPAQVDSAVGLAVAIDMNELLHSIISGRRSKERLCDHGIDAPDRALEGDVGAAALDAHSARFASWRLVPAAG